MRAKTIPGSPSSWGLGKKFRGRRHLGKYTTKPYEPTELEFRKFYGSTKLLRFFQDRLSKRDSQYFAPPILPGDLTRLRFKAAALRRELQRLDDKVLRPHAEGLSAMKPLTGDAPAAWSRELRPRQQVLEAVAFLRHFEGETSAWQKEGTTGSLQPRKGKQDIGRYYLLGLLVPYTAFIARTGRPQWRWIQRWLQERLGPAAPPNAFTWWRDNTRNLRRLPDRDIRKRYALLYPSILFLQWLGFFGDHFKEDSQDLEHIGNQFLGNLIENCPSVSPSILSELSDFWREVIKVKVELEAGKISESEVGAVVQRLFSKFSALADSPLPRARPRKPS